MNEHRMIVSICRCGKPLDAATGVNDEAAPKPGDVSVCFYCGTINIFEDDLSLRAASSDEERQIIDSPSGRWVLVLRQIAKGNAHRG